MSDYSNTKKRIFAKASSTYYATSLFFPKSFKASVFCLYAFVRTADDYVDAVVPDRAGFFAFKQQTESAWGGAMTGNHIVDDFVALARKCGFEKTWIDAFLQSMEDDLAVKSYPTFADLERYIFGSADVIGYMMAALMRLPKETYVFAGALGKAMQIINFIRDIREDLALGRVYMPQEDMKQFGLSQISEPPHDEEYRKSFEALIRFEIVRYREVLSVATRGFRYIPYRLRVPIVTASNLYAWVADRIDDDPNIVWRKGKVRPSRYRVLYEIIRASLLRQ